MNTMAPIAFGSRLQEMSGIHPPAPLKSRDRRLPKSQRRRKRSKTPRRDRPRTVDDDSRELSLLPLVALLARLFSCAGDVPLGQTSRPWRTFGLNNRSLLRHQNPWPRIKACTTGFLAARAGMGPGPRCQWRRDQDFLSVVHNSRRCIRCCHGESEDSLGTSTSRSHCGSPLVLFSTPHARRPPWKHLALDRRNWFPAKRYGWGWGLPGHVAGVDCGLVAFAGLLGAGFLVFPAEQGNGRRCSSTSFFLRRG